MHVNYPHSKSDNPSSSCRLSLIKIPFRSTSQIQSPSVNSHNCRAQKHVTVLASLTATLENSTVGTHHFSQDNRVHDTIPKVPIAEPRRLEIAKQAQHRGYYFLTGPNLAGHWMLIVLLIVHTTIHHTSSNLSLSLSH